MKVNLGVTITDEERATFNKNLGDKSMASRKQVVAFLEDCLAGALAYGEPVAQPKAKKSKPVVRSSNRGGFNMFLDNGDPALEGKSKGYIHGWNKVKYRKQLPTHSE